MFEEILAAATSAEDILAALVHRLARYAVEEPLRLRFALEELATSDKRALELRTRLLDTAASTWVHAQALDHQQGRTPRLVTSEEAVGWLTMLHGLCCAATDLASPHERGEKVEGFLATFRGAHPLI